MLTPLGYIYKEKMNVKYVYLSVKREGNKSAMADAVATNSNRTRNNGSNQNQPPPSRLYVSEIFPKGKRTAFIGYVIRANS